MAGPGAGSTKDVLRSIVTGPSSRWVEVAALALIALMLMAIKTLGGGPGLAAALLAVGAVSLLMAVRGILARPQPAWYRWFLRGLGVLSLVGTVGSAAVVVVAVVAKLVR
jgi:hypothetical protein